MGIFRRREAQHSNKRLLPGDIAQQMERYGRFEFYGEAHRDAGAEVGRMMGELYPIASADPQAFLAALAEAVLPTGGWAVYGASRLVWELLSPLEPYRQNPSYNAIMNAALDFLRTNGVRPKDIRPYEWHHWIDSGGTADTWVSRLPEPSPAEAPITALLPGESRKVAQLTSEPDSSVILVRQEGEGRYGALMEVKWSDEDPRRVQNEWKSAGSLYELYMMIGLWLQTPPPWYDRELEPYFPLPRPKI